MATEVAAPVRTDAREPDAPVLTLWTDDPARARAADDAGVDRIGPDLERLGKQDRQAGLGTWISPHREEALAELRGLVAPGRLFARTEPVNPGTASEVERLVAHGVDVLMLPMLRDAQDVRRYVDAVAGRALVVLLVETMEAVRNLEEIVAVPGVDEVHVGLNDLSLSLRTGNRFGVLGTPLMQRIAEITAAAGLPFGFGGIARPFAEVGPVPPDLVYAQYARLGGTRALVAQSFFPRPDDPGRVDLATALGEVRARFAHWFAQPPAALDAARDALLAATAGLQQL